MKGEHINEVMKETGIGEDRLDRLAEGLGEQSVRDRAERVEQHHPGPLSAVPVVSLVDKAGDERRRSGEIRALLQTVERVLRDELHDRAGNRRAIEHLQQTLPPHTVRQVHYTSTHSFASGGMYFSLCGDFTYVYVEII